MSLNRYATFLLIIFIFPISLKILYHNTSKDVSSFWQHILYISLNKQITIDNAIVPLIK